MKARRTEWKYLCSEAELSLIEARLRAVLPYDKHANSDGGYAIHSLYFDDHKDSFSRDNEAGNPMRKKYRLRYYENDCSRITLECKEKQYDMCCKQSSLLTPFQLDQILQCRWEELFWHTDDPLLKKFALEGFTRRLAPKEIVDYTRIVFVDDLLHIRITLDRNISVSAQTDKFLTGNYAKLPLLPQHRHILEVKFDMLLPGHLRALVTSADVSRTAFSKYYLGRLRLQAAGQLSTLSMRKEYTNEHIESRR